MNLKTSILGRRQFWVILLITFVLWCITVLSEQRTYNEEVNVQWTGYDTARCLISTADTKLRFSLQSNGFTRFTRKFTLRSHPLVLTATADTTYNGNDCLQLILDQYNLHGVHSLQTNTESLAMHLEYRQKKAFVPKMRGVEFSFVSTYGLYGTPRISPDTVWLYGSEASLNALSDIYTAPAKIEGITKSTTHTLPLEPVWKKYPDLHASVESVDIYIPTESYVNQSFTLPITDIGSLDTTIHLYPSNATVTLWVPQSKAKSVSEKDIELTVDSRQATTRSDKLAIHATRFPNYTRVKKIDPDEASFVIIR